MTKDDLMTHFDEIVTDRRLTRDAVRPTSTVLRATPTCRRLRARRVGP
jgi:hypothetical protein